mmetsp:Transcript_18093/g.40799  ORF Transcript_18093/g.40799 Transcript_18093/m.40799 type:complete len:205 (-) Transcript_18093:430-1044(-)
MQLRHGGFAEAIAHHRDVQLAVSYWDNVLLDICKSLQQDVRFIVAPIQIAVRYCVPVLNGLDESIGETLLVEINDSLHISLRCKLELSQLISDYVRGPRRMSTSAHLYVEAAISVTIVAPNHQCTTCVFVQVPQATMVLNRTCNAHFKVTPPSLLVGTQVRVDRTSGQWVSVHEHKCEGMRIPFVHATKTCIEALPLLLGEWPE